jgi:hypothetical protein
MNLSIVAYAILAALVGLLSGFQGIYERYRIDSFRAASTAPGILYLITRAAVPGLLFYAAYAYKLVSADWLLLKALGFGAGTEVVLRSKIYVKQTAKDAAQFEELLKGPLDLLKWYQDLFLTLAAARLAKIRKSFIDRNLPAGGGFTDLCAEVLNNLGAWPSQEDRAMLETAINNLQQKYTAEKNLGANGQLDRKYRLKLGYLVLDRLGKSGFKTLVATR